MRDYGNATAAQCTHSVYLNEQAHAVLSPRTQRFTKADPAHLPAHRLGDSPVVKSNSGVSGLEVSLDCGGVLDLLRMEHGGILASARGAIIHSNLSGLLGTDTHLAIVGIHVGEVPHVNPFWRTGSRVPHCEWTTQKHRTENGKEHLFLRHRLPPRSTLEAM